MTGDMMHLVPALFGFSGRMRRRDFWFYTVLSNFLLFVLVLIDIIVPQTLFPVPKTPDPVMPSGTAATGIAVLFILTLCLGTWIAAALMGKRLHDRGRPLWWLFAWLVPVVGWGVLFVECGLLEGSAAENAYGPPSKPQ